MRGWVVVWFLLFLVEVAGATLLTNGGFETWSGGVPDNWTISGSGLSTEQEGDTVLVGTSSCKLVWTITTTRWILQKHPVTAGIEYTYSFWVYDNDPFGRVRTTLMWRKADGSAISSVNTPYSVDGTDWQELTLSDSAPPLAGSVYVEIRVYDVAWGDSITSASVFVDFARFCSIPTISDSGNVVINEIMYNPSGTQGTDANFEWIELWNLDTDTMNMGGWTVSDVQDTFTIPGSTHVAPGHFLVVARNPNAIKGESQYSDNLGSDAILVGPSGLILANAGDEVVVKNKDGKLIDSLTYGTASPWPTSPDGGGPSLELYNPTLDNRQGESWLGATETYGTPGDTNSTFRWIAKTGSWHLSSTWSPEGVPTPGFGVEIPADTTVTISAGGGNVYCRDLIIKGTLTHNGGIDDTLFVYGDWKNDGTFNRGTGTVTFKGGGRKEIDKNTGAAGRERFHNLVIDLSSITDTIMAESRTISPVYYDSIWAANFTMKNGTFIQEQEQVKVDTNFTLSGGRYVMSGDDGEIEVEGDVVISSEFIFEQPEAAILCAGNLSISGNNTFISHNGRVLMDGYKEDHNTVSISGTGNFINFFKIEATDTDLNLTDSVSARSDITVNRMSIIWGVYSPGGHKTTVTDTALFVGRGGTLRMNNPGDTLALKRGLWLSEPAHQAKTDISDGVIRCDGQFTDLTETTDRRFQASGGEVRFGGGPLTTVIGTPQFHSLTIDNIILDVDSTNITSYITVTHDTTFLGWGAIQKIQHRKVVNNADTIFYDGFGRAALLFIPTAGSMDSVRVHTRFGSMMPENAFGSGCAAGISSPKRYFNISPKNPGTATVKIYYYEGERGPIPADQMLQVRWDTTISHWDILPGDSTTRGRVDNLHWVQVTGVNQFSPFTLGGPGALAVELVFFNAVPGNGYITLNWSTASERGNKRWNLYRREGDEDIEMIFSVRGQGTVPHPTEYQYNDTLIVPDKTYHYKLAAVDENGDTTWYGPIVATAEFEFFKSGFSGIYPNPFMQETVIKFTVNGSQFTGKNRQLLTVNCQLKIHCVAGRVVQSLVDGEVKPGHHTVRFDGRNLASGIYFARLVVGDFKDTKKIVLLRR